MISLINNVNFVNIFLISLVALTSLPYKDSQGSNPPPFKVLVDNLFDTVGENTIIMETTQKETE